jgi:hypothetical protein
MWSRFYLLHGSKRISKLVFLYKLKFIGYCVSFLCSFILASNDYDIEHSYEVHIHVSGLRIHISYLITQSFELL